MKQLRELNQKQSISANITLEILLLAGLVALKTYFFDRSTMIRFVSDYRKVMHSIPNLDSVMKCTNLITIDEE